MMRRTCILSTLAAAATAEVYFSETFDSLDKWTSSTWKPEAEMEAFKLKTGEVSADEKDTALATTQDARFYASSANFEPFSNDGKTLVLQYSVKYDKDIECGGGYLKMGAKIEDPTTFGDPTKYAIMFGPDKCGYTKRTHLIFTYNGKNILKKTDLPYKQDTLGATVIYRLVVKPDSTVQVYADGDEIYSGKMEEDWEMLEPKEILDEDDKKPSEWVDDSMMDDPAEKKPEDWVEEKQTVDKDAKQPEDWDSEEDGEWEAPMIDNPDYKGEWKAKRISNPAYKGAWVQKKIDNPKYKADDALYKLGAAEGEKLFGFIGFDVWQVKAGALFDNVLIADSIEEADKVIEPIKKLQEAEKEAKKKKDEEAAAAAKSTGDKDEDDDDDDDESDKKETKADADDDEDL